MKLVNAHFNQIWYASYAAGEYNLYTTPAGVSYSIVKINTGTSTGGATSGGTLQIYLNGVQLPVEYENAYGYFMLLPGQRIAMVFTTNTTNNCVVVEAAEYLLEDGDETPVNFQVWVPNVNTLNQFYVNNTTNVQVMKVYSGVPVACYVQYAAGGDTFDFMVDTTNASNKNSRDNAVIVPPGAKIMGWATTNPGPLFAQGWNNRGSW